MLNPRAARGEAPLPGIIDTLTAGYAAINRRWWVLAIPLLLDVFLWLGPQVSFAPVIDPLLLRTSEVVRASQAGAPPPPPNSRRANQPSSTVIQEIEALRQRLSASTTDTNALGLLARGPLALPSVATLVGGVGRFSFVISWGEALALLFSTLSGGIVLGAIYRTAIAQEVRDGRADVVRALERVPLDVARVLGFLFTVLGLTLALGIPAAILMGVAALFAPALETVVLTMAMALAFFLSLHLFFALDAIFVSGLGPWQAMRVSFLVVRRFLWSTLGLILLTILIALGFDRVWELLAATLSGPAGVALGMLGNAYIVSGLVAASMIFYRERSERLATLTARQRSA